MKLTTRSRTIFITLTVIASLFLSGSVIRVNAGGTPTVVISAIHGHCDIAACTMSMTLTVADEVMVTSFNGDGTCSGVTDTNANVYSLIRSQGLGKVFASTVTTGGTTTISVTGCDGSFTSIAATEYTQIGAIGNVASSSGTPVTPVTVQDSFSSSAGSAIFELFTFQDNGGIGCNTPTAQNGQSKSIDDCSNNGVLGIYLSHWNSAPSGGTNTFGINVSGLGGATITYSHILVELLQTATGTSTSVTRCYGNCGSPAITLVNTNSTHTVNFNQSITLFYQFQADLNGFLVNITTNLAKSYSSSFNAPFLALYTASCNAGVQPGSTQCPFVKQIGGQTSAFSKGRVLITGGPGFPVTIGQWIAVALSAQISGLDVNDTNTNVQMFQTSGIIPAVISQDTVFSTSKIGLWSWIQGNVIITPPITAGPCVNNFAQLDCLIPGMVNGMCTVVTASCQTSGALFWIIILTFLSFLVATIGFSSAHITKFVGAGEVFMFLFLGWFFIFVGVGVLESFVVIFFLFIGSVAFAKTARNYF